MNRNHIRYLVAFLILCVMVGAAHAGGWAVITLDDLPDHAVAGKPIKLVFVVRQHGRTLLTGLQPRVRAISATGLVANSAVFPAIDSYSAILTLPQPGEWTITINSGFVSSATTLPVLKVIAPSDPVPAPLSQAARGERLFVAKGCTGCHLHSEITPERTAFATLDLSTRRFPPDYLAQFLADPSIKSAEMQKLNLKESEIAALVAFLDKTSVKSSKRK